jgi:FkbM family methyltransferase
MSLKGTLQFIAYHPLNKDRKTSAILKFFFWQIRNLFTKIEIQFKFGERSKLHLKKGLTGASGNYYCGLHDFSEMAFLLHFLREGDQFVDVGANIGSYTILAGSECGCNTMAFEPIPSTFSELKKNTELNDLSKLVECHNVGLGSENSTIKFTKSLDTVNHVALENEKDVIEIDVKKLDDLTKEDKIRLIKIDVEGFESEVINGSNRILTSDLTKAIIIELNGSGERYGYKDIDIHNQLLDFNFKPFSYDPSSRSIKPLNDLSEDNILYLKDLPFVNERIASARKFTIQGVSF